MARRRGAGRVAFATVLFASGLGLLANNPAQSIGGLCNGRPASHTWLDASGQPGPSFFDGTNRDDTIVGRDGDDWIKSSDDDEVDKVSAGDGFDICFFSAGDELANCEY
ncbi:MAG TPA: hypothetical protein VEG38_12570 [Acidimicrobiia bacterium]|nr:hypothetical protein [Acidimicrobiia bacterium]